MKRFLKIHALLVLGLFLLVFGTNATLEKMEPVSSVSSVRWYDGQGRLSVAYDGDLAHCPGFEPATAPAKSAESFSLHIF